MNVIVQNPPPNCYLAYLVVTSLGAALIAPLRVMFNLTSARNDLNRTY